MQISFSKQSTTFIIFLALWSSSYALGQSDGFNFPVGPRNPGKVTASTNDDGWYNAQGFQVENQETGTNGYHSGEDWNDECGGENDVGATVYAVANGEVVSNPVEKFGATSGESIGHLLVLKHALPTDDDTEEFVYSLYLHIDVANGITEGATVKRDQPIGSIADISASGLGSHLHFELRTKSVDLDDPWPSDDDSRPGNAYYNASTDETLDEIMAKDGLVEAPTQFIANNRPPSYKIERGPIPSTFTFQRDLEAEVCRHEVRYLQMLLNHDPVTTVANVEDPGSLGNETSTFGPATIEAVKAFQEAYLDWTEDSPGWGSVGQDTRRELNDILSSVRAYPSVDVALIIDSSGSMTTNDPTAARLDASRAYLTGSFSGDFVGVVDFDSNARLASPLLELPANKDALVQAIESIDSSGGTDIGAGILTGCGALVDSSSIRNITKGAILLTDGVGGNSAQRECFKKKRWPIYTFGLGAGVDEETLETIASDTGGEYTALPDNKVICEFQRVRAKIAGAEPPPCNAFVIWPFEYVYFYVEVEPGQLQATFSIDWLGSDIEATLTTPSGRVINRNLLGQDVAHDKGESFEIFNIASPEPGEWEVELFGADIPEGGEEAVFGFSSVPSPIITANIDVKPDDETNAINPRARGVLPVAMLGSGDMENGDLGVNIPDVDVATVRLGANEARAKHAGGHWEDVDGDGDTDLLLHFPVPEIGINCGDTSVRLTAETVSGQPLEGTDLITTVGCK